MTHDDRIPYNDLGQMTVAFGWLDLMCHLVAWNLIGVDERRGAAITEGMTIDRVLALARRVASQREADPDLPPDARVRLDQVLPVIPALIGRRNAVTHAIWRPYKGGYGAARIWDFNKGVVNLRHVEPEEVAELTDDCWHAVGQLIQAGAVLMGFEAEDED